MVIPAPDMSVIDLGCGTGELTAVLHAHLAARATQGADVSDTMLARSGKFGAPGLTFQKLDISSFNPGEKFDLVYSNAALQWVNNHEELFGRLVGALNAGGQIAVQMPVNDDYPTHVVARRIAGESPFREALAGYTGRRDVLAPEKYAELLNALGCSKQMVKVQVYAHHLESRESVVEWVKGALLTDFEGRMSPELYAQFLERYKAELLPMLEDRRPFFYPFKRIFIWGQK
jgi:trans-aconitate 2-methyltransferase